MNLKKHCFNRGAGLVCSNMQAGPVSLEQVLVEQCVTWRGIGARMEDIGPEGGDDSFAVFALDLVAAQERAHHGTVRLLTVARCGVRVSVSYCRERARPHAVGGRICHARAPGQGCHFLLMLLAPLSPCWWLAHACRGGREEPKSKPTSKPAPKPAPAARAEQNHGKRSEPGRLGRRRRSVLMVCGSVGTRG